MRTTIEIDELLLRDAMTVTGLLTKDATVDEALRRLVRSHRQAQAIADLAGIGWEGDLDASRRNLPADPPA